MADQSHYKVTANLGGLDVPVVRLTLNEALSEPYEAQLDFYDAEYSWRQYNQGPVDFATLLDNGADITLWDQDTPVRHLQGVIHQLKAGAMGNHRRYYTATIVPALSALKLTYDCRIFQNLDVREIVSKLLREHGVVFHTFDLEKPRVRRAYCVQYEESVYAFIHRLLAEEGIFYYFEHAKGVSHKLIFSDRSDLLPHIGPLGYQTRSANKTEPCIWGFDYTEQRVVSQTTQRDRTFRNPNYTLEHTSKGRHLEHQQSGQYKTYRYSGRYKKDNQGKPFTEHHQRQHQNQQRVAVFVHDYLQVQAGQTFDLKNHPDDTHNQAWITTRNHLEIEQPQVSHEEAQALFNLGKDPAPQNASRFELTTWAIPHPQRYSPPAWPKPVIEGTQIADVVGPSPEQEIFCDEYGRVAVKFPWDRYAKGDHTSSCWIRVAQNWAGAGWGHIAIPRIGQEVVVAYDNGDPDQPIIIGRTYNANNLPPYKLSEYMTRMVIKSKTYKGDGHNELYFDDNTNKEEIYIHAQKDQNNIVLNDETTRVDHDRTEQVGNDEKIKIGHDRTEEVGNDEKIKIGHDRAEQVGNDETIAIGANRSETVGKDQTTKISGDHAETVEKNKSEKIAIDKALKIGANYKIDVGEAKKENVGSNSSEQVGTKKHVIVGQRFELEVGQSSLILNADGTIILRGKEIQIEGGKQVTVKGKMVEVN